MLKIVLIAAAVAVLGCIPLMGLPGALWGYAAAPLFNLVRGAYAYQAMMDRLGPSTWGLAIMTTLTWPIALIPGYLVGKAKGPLAFAAVTIVLAVIITTVVSLLATRGTEVKDRDYVFAAIRHDDTRYVERAAEAGRLPADPLFYAIEADAEDVALLLLDRGASPHAFESNAKHGYYQGGTTPAHLAAGRGQMRTLKGLFAKGVSPTLTDETGATLAHAALGTDERHDPRFLDELAKLGVDYRALDHDGATPLIHLARINAPIDWAGTFGATMLRLGVDPTARDKAGKSALDYARDRYHGALIDVLSAVPSSKTP